MESVVSTEEEGKFNTSVTATLTIASYNSYPPFLEQLENMASESNSISDNYGSEAKNDGATETVKWDEGGKDQYLYVGSIEDHITLKLLH